MDRSTSRDLHPQERLERPASLALAVFPRLQLWTADSALAS